MPTGQQPLPILQLPHIRCQSTGQPMSTLCIAMLAQSDDSFAVLHKNMPIFAIWANHIAQRQPSTIGGASTTPGIGLHLSVFPSGHLNSHRSCPDHPHRNRCPWWRIILDGFHQVDPPKNGTGCQERFSSQLWRRHWQCPM